MTVENDQLSSRPPTRDLADVVVPRRPAGIPYADGEDYDAQALLRVNGYSLETAELIDTLESELGILQAAAARTLGARGEGSAISALKQLVQDRSAEETARVQAAYALTRLGIPDASEILISLLDIDPEISPAPLQAAGALARLGDLRGYVVIRAALDSPSRVTAMVACKQLLSLAGIDGQSLPGGGHVDLIEAFRAALTRPEANIRGEAMAQLNALDTDPPRALLAEFENRQL